MYIIFFLLFVAQVSAFTMEQANITVWLSAAAYCSKDVYPTMKLTGPATGFVVKDVLYDYTSDLQGYVGILPSQQKIYIVFRGSSSVRNWIEDLEIKKVDYVTFPECNCKVHDGFYKSTKNVIDQVTNAAKLLQKQYGYEIIVTGHSYGAATCQLAAMELYAKGIKSSVYNFGQPLVGDDAFAVFVNTKIDNLWRIVHNKDMVPHVPPEEFNYQHSCQEVFEDEKGNIKLCSETDCTDSTCSHQYDLKETNTKDHEIYLEHTMSCENSVIL
jgi:hypothetical protein